LRPRADEGTVQHTAKLRATMARLVFRSGTLEIHGLEESSSILPDAARYDARTACHRAPALAYADVVLALRRAGVEYEDEARRYGELASGAAVRREPRPYQREAIAAWKKHRGQGVVVLPTGAGK